LKRLTIIILSGPNRVGEDRTRRRAFSKIRCGENWYIKLNVFRPWAKTRSSRASAGGPRLIGYRWCSRAGDLRRQADCRREAVAAPGQSDGWNQRTVNLSGAYRRISLGAVSNVWETRSRLILEFLEKLADQLRNKEEIAPEVDISQTSRASTRR
jgi:hypothetical protein